RWKARLGSAARGGAWNLPPIGYPAIWRGSVPFGRERSLPAGDQVITNKGHPMKHVSRHICLERPSLGAQMVFLLGSLAVAVPTWAQSDEFDDLRTKWKDMLTGGASFDPADPDIANRIAAIDGEARTQWSRMNTAPDRAYLWSDLASTTVSSHITSSYNRLKSMALAFSTHGSSLEGDPALLADILGGLDWMNVN